MPHIFHKSDLKFEERKSTVQEFKWLTSPRFRDIVKSKHLHFDVRSLDPGKFSFPYHFHRASEELFMIISGEATLRSPEGFQKVIEGDLVFFGEGPADAHQLFNDGDVPCVYLDIRSYFGIDITEYPDSGKLAISPMMETFETSCEVDYYKGEENVRKNWPEEILKKAVK